MVVQVFATALDTYFRLTVMLMILMLGSILLPHLQPFEDHGSQIVQVSLQLSCRLSAHSVQLVLSESSIESSMH